MKLPGVIGMVIVVGGCSDNTRIFIGNEEQPTLFTPSYDEDSRTTILNYKITTCPDYKYDYTYIEIPKPKHQPRIINYPSEGFTHSIRKKWVRHKARHVT